MYVVIDKVTIIIEQNLYQILFQLQFMDLSDSSFDSVFIQQSLCEDRAKTETMYTLCLGVDKWRAPQLDKRAK
jgi:hypothetical protein